MLELFQSSPLGLFLSADISPPPQSEILFLHRFEAEEEVGRWSRQKRQACGPLTTSCSLFCDTKTVPRSVLRTALSPARHSRRRNPPFQIRIAPRQRSKGGGRAICQGTKTATVIQQTEARSLFSRPPVLTPGGGFLMQQLEPLTATDFPQKLLPPLQQRKKTAYWL